jgi:hypothetical protein
MHWYIPQMKQYFELVDGRNQSLNFGRILDYHLNKYIGHF